jgi:ABC-type uncharacterized transport system substrate-binding protein
MSAARLLELAQRGFHRGQEPATAAALGIEQRRRSLQAAGQRSGGVPVDLYFAPATPMATAAWYADKTPIVVATIMDPVELKFVKSLARLVRASPA